MVKAGVIGQELADKPLDFNFQRAARTDKAVSAVRQCCSMWLDLEKDANIDTVPSLINAQLPDDIRVMGLKRATKGFHCQKNCDSRTYSYTLPTFSFAPCVENTNMKFRISEEQLAEVNKLLGIYKGTHNFFNYTAKREHSDKSCFRYIISFECGKPFVYHDAVHGEVEFATIQIRGASFMLHQIRKMIGMVIAIMRGLANKSVIQKTWEEKRVDVPRAPGLGLMLEKVHYTTYDRKFSKTHATLDEWPECAAAIEEFREKCILANILKTEMKDNSMMNWLSVLLYHTYDGCEEGAPKPFCHAQHQINAANASESTENDKDTDAAERDDEKDDVTERKGIEGEGDSLVQADEGAKNVKAAIGER
uniref:Pseudouridine synthase I TruA alpha/beta domain-containing protein n=1 Tax=Plectus sambesii TaxID=2011161 RepID=A0A914UZ24_9BILA